MPVSYNNYPYGPYGAGGYPYTQQVNPMAPAQSYSTQPQIQQTQGIIWVDGEVGAKAYQMPQGWPAGSPIPLWDTNDQIIYLKSMNQMGMPNPLQRIHYQMEDIQNVSMLPAAQGTVSGSPEYVTKADLEEFKNELRDLIKQNQTGGRSNQNRGGNQ